MSRDYGESLTGRFQSLEQTVSALEEVNARLNTIQDTLIPLSDNAERMLLNQTEKEAESTTLQSLLNHVEIIARLLEQVELETDVLEKRISTIERFKTR